MYTLPSFALDDDAAVRVLARAGAGFLVHPGPEGLTSVFVPLVLSADRRTLTTHVARANSWWREADGAPVLVLVLDASSYVSPRWYPSLAEAPAVPTWNYVAAEVRGVVRVHDDLDWVRRQVVDQTRHFEGDGSDAWRVESVDADYVERMCRAIVGVEIEVSSIEAKAKLSQNRPDEDRLTVRTRLAAGDDAQRRTASWMGDA